MDRRGLLLLVMGTLSTVACVFVVVLALGTVRGAEAQEVPPATLEEVFETEPASERVVKFADERRQAAMRDAAFSFGLQSGLVRRAFELGQVLDRYERQLDRVYRFESVLIEREGFQVLPPVVVETTQAFRREGGGRRAATARRVLRIERAAEVVAGRPGGGGISIGRGRRRARRLRCCSPGPARNGSSGESGYARGGWKGRGSPRKRSCPISIG